MEWQYTGLDGRLRTIDIPDKAWKIHITWGSNFSNKGVFLWYMINGDWKIHCLSKTRWMHNMSHFSEQLKTFLTPKPEK